MAAAGPGYIMVSDTEGVAISNGNRRGAGGAGGAGWLLAGCWLAAGWLGYGIDTEQSGLRLLNDTTQIQRTSARNTDMARIRHFPRKRDTDTMQIRQQLASHTYTVSDTILGRYA